MPLVANFGLDVVKEELERVGIYLLEEFPDGQTRWGTEPLAKPYKVGSFTMASEYLRDRYDIFSIRAILARLGREDRIPEVDERLFARINEGPDFQPPRSTRKVGP